MASGACTSGWTALPKDAMSRASGGATTTSTGNEPIDVPLMVDADAGPDMVRHRRLVPRHVGRDDPGDDAAGADPDAAALPRGRGSDGRRAPRCADGHRGRRLLLRADRQ